MGGYKNEQQFKMYYIKNAMETGKKGQKIFCIETEETVLGFPDVMEVVTINDINMTTFYEFKVSNKAGVITFRPAQLSFYKNNAQLNTRIIAYDRKNSKVHSFFAKEIFQKNNPYAIELGNRLNLAKAEERLQQCVHL